MLTFEQRRLLLHHGSAEYGELLIKLLEGMAESNGEDNYKLWTTGLHDEWCNCPADTAYRDIREYEIQAMGEHVAG